MHLCAGRAAGAAGAAGAAADRACSVCLERATDAPFFSVFVLDKICLHLLDGCRFQATSSSTTAATEHFHRRFIKRRPESRDRMLASER